MRMLRRSFAIHTNRVYTANMKSDLQRVNITLPSQTLQRIDRVARPGTRSRVIDEAVNFYLKEHGRANLRKLLKEGAIANAEQDRKIATDWFHIEKEVWDKLDQ